MYSINIHDTGEVHKLMYHCKQGASYQTESILGYITLNNISMNENVLIFFKINQCKLHLLSYK